MTHGDTAASICGVDAAADVAGPVIRMAFTGQTSAQALHPSHCAANKSGARAPGGRTTAGAGGWRHAPVNKPLRSVSRPRMVRESVNCADPSFRVRYTGWKKTFTAPPDPVTDRKSGAGNNQETAEKPGVDTLLEDERHDGRGF